MPPVPVPVPVPVPPPAFPPPVVPPVFPPPVVPPVTVLLLLLLSLPKLLPSSAQLVNSIDTLAITINRSEVDTIFISISFLDLSKVKLRDGEDTTELSILDMTAMAVIYNNWQPGNLPLPPDRCDFSSHIMSALSYYHKSITFLLLTQNRTISKSTAKVKRESMCI